MMPKKTKPALPTEAQTRILRRLAQNGGFLRLTHDVEKGDRYHDDSGVVVPIPTARVLIRNLWVVAERDSMFDTTPQSWAVRAP